MANTRNGKGEIRWLRRRVPAAGGAGVPVLEPRTRFAHLTDLHFTTLQQKRYPIGVQVLREAIAHLNAQDLDFVLFTGDLFHFPERIAEDLPAFRALLADLRHPYYVAFGNHDVEGDGTDARKALLMAGLGDSGLSRGAPYYDFGAPGLPGVRFVMLDSTDVEGADYHTWRGRFSVRQAEWLEQKLADHADEAVVVGIHHPPVTPYPFMGSLKFEEEDRQRLVAALDTHPNVAMVLSGHYHMAGRTPLGRTSVLTGPSLVEHPHGYRVFTMRRSDEGLHVSYTWQRVPLPATVKDEGNARARLRGMALHRLSRGRAGELAVR